jgi:NADP-dependent 3-hydroxy acid dehydrogenase YdfG
MINKVSARAHRDVVVISGTLAATASAAIRQFACHGALIGILGHGHQALEQARREAEAAGGEAIALPVDVANPGEVESASSVVEKHFGPIDVWINNAVADAFHAASAADSIRRVTEAAYLAVVHGTMAALKLMLPRNRGAIVQVAPICADSPLYSSDCGAKTLIQGFCESMRAELKRDARDVSLTTVEIPLESGFHPFISCAGWLGPAPDFAVVEAQAAAEAIYAAAFGHERPASDARDSLQGELIADAMRVLPRPAGSRLR